MSESGIDMAARLMEDAAATICRDMGYIHDLPTATQVSIAISLKRIADSMEHSSVQGLEIRDETGPVDWRRIIEEAQRPIASTEKGE